MVQEKCRTTASVHLRGPVPQSDQLRLMAFHLLGPMLFIPVLASQTYRFLIQWNLLEIVLFFIAVPSQLFQSLHQLEVLEVVLSAVALH